MIVKDALSNGMVLVTESMPQVRSVAIGVWLKRGSRHEREAQTGISHFIEHMVFKGTAQRSAEQIAEEVDAIGGHMDAFTSKEYAAFHLKVLDEHLPRAVDLLADVVRHPAFAEEEIAREKRVILEEIAMVEDTPDDLVMELFTGAFWPDHPLGRPILGTRRSVKGFTRSELLSFFRTTYRPGDLFVTAAGNLDHAETAAMLERYLGDVEPGKPASRGRAPRPREKVVTRSRKELEQVHLFLGYPALPQGHDDRYAAWVLNTILGGSMSSRLFQRVREREGLVYSISSGMASYSDAGNLGIYAGTGLAATDKVLSLTNGELRRLMDEPVSESELQRARDHLKGSLMLSLESTGSRMNHLARQEITLGRQVELDQTLERIEAVTAADVQRLAQEFFQGPAALSVLGNLKGYRPRVAHLRP